MNNGFFLVSGTVNKNEIKEIDLLSEYGLNEIQNGFKQQDVLDETFTKYVEEDIAEIKIEPIPIEYSLSGLFDQAKAELQIMQDQEIFNIEPLPRELIKKAFFLQPNSNVQNKNITGLKRKRNSSDSEDEPMRKKQKTKDKKKRKKKRKKERKKEREKTNFNN
eukprot:TRINITY_DN297_c5_g1_i1.p1 TRINITY_DN297_c5_g1~~TRINITY_DN297_c5_g1_i1.p1  ORF type:complete len:163 (-),score=42.14 TRINITY_DN297_c5_g1_i1:58-546(-)